MAYLPYTYQTFIQTRQQLALRLSDPGMVFWTDAELKLYITEALRVWNALTAQWIVDFVFTAKAADASYWYDLSGLYANPVAGSPRAYSVTDTDLYTIMEYHLLEPATGGVWTGTSQFGISDLSQAVQRRRDEVMQMTATGVVRLPGVPFPVPPYNRRTILPDNVLEVRRARWSPPPTPPLGLSSSVLWREDPASFDFFAPSHIQTPKVPRSYSLTTQPPLSLDTDFPPPVPGTLDLLAIQAGPALNPPTTTPLRIPDDWSWVVKYGALADLLTKESEARDDLRADYCLKRYIEGITLMQRLPWITAARLDDVPCGLSSVYEKDRYDCNWETRASARKSIITAGTDLFAVAPVPSLVTRSPAGLVGVTLQLVENAPLPVADGDNIQLSRDALDAVLCYSQHIASWKQGGSEFTSTYPLFDVFRKAAMAANQRLGALGMYYDWALEQGREEEDNDQRFLGAANAETTT